MEEKKSKTYELHAEKPPTISKPTSPDITKIDENTSDNGDILLNLIAEIVVENIIRKLRHEHKK